MVFNYICRATRGARELRVQQDRLGEVRVFVVPEENPPADLVPQILAQVKRKLGRNDEVHVEVVDNIERTGSNKYRVVVSKVAERLVSGQDGGSA